MSLCWCPCGLRDGDRDEVAAFQLPVSSLKGNRKGPSISVRSQRVTTETAHVSVRLSEELLQPNPDGSGTHAIDSEKLIAAAIELGRHPATDWSAEREAVIVPHPIQRPRQ